MGNEKIIFLCEQFINEVNKTYPIHLAYLFGSRARGTENSMSDVDIALLFGKEYSDMDDAFARGDIMEIGVKFFKLPVDIVSLNKATLSLKYEVVKDGILILESSPSVKVEFETKTIREYLDFKYYLDQYNEAIINSIKNKNYFGG